MTVEEVQEIMGEVAHTGERSMDIVLARGMATEYDIAKAMTRHLQMPFVSPTLYNIEDDVRETLPPHLLHNLMVLPYGKFGRLLVLATTGDLEMEDIREIEHQSDMTVNFAVALKSEIKRALDKEFPREKLGQEVVSRLDELFGA